MDIQPLIKSDISSLFDLIPPGWDTALPAIEFYTYSNFCLPFKISINNKIAGTGTAIIHNQTAWLAHIIVHPEYRNRGLGKIITEHLVDTAYSKNCETIYLLATELGEPVYKKLGFETEAKYVFYLGNRSLSPLIQSENIVLFKNEFKDQISDLDLHTSGEDRMFHLEKYLSNSFIFIKEKEVHGYYLPGFGNGLIIADTNEAGIELMKLRLRSKNFAVFPEDNLRALEFMMLNNFRPERTQKRMRLGKKRNWQATNIYNRIGGNLG